MPTLTCFSSTHDIRSRFLFSAGNLHVVVPTIVLLNKGFLPPLPPSHTTSLTLLPNPLLFNMEQLSNPGGAPAPSAGPAGPEAPAIDPSAILVELV